MIIDNLNETKCAIVVVALAEKPELASLYDKLDKPPTGVRLGRRAEPPIWMRTSCATYIASRYRNFMSMEWMDVKTLVLPWTTHSRVSGIAMGVQVARKTGSSRDDKGRTPK